MSKETATTVMAAGDSRALQLGLASLRASLAQIEDRMIDLHNDVMTTQMDMASMLEQAVDEVARLRSGLEIRISETDDGEAAAIEHGGEASDHPLAEAIWHVYELDGLLTRLGCGLERLETAAESLSWLAQDACQHGEDASAVLSSPDVGTSGFGN